jgi:predicted DsbA family dithiol-disulfide isomerase
MSDILKVDLWSDSACPWCYVGKRRFEEGVRRYHERGGNRTVQVEYHSLPLYLPAPPVMATAYGAGSPRTISAWPVICPPGNA